MKRALIGLALLPLFTGSALAAAPAAGLSDPQLDVVTAGTVPTLPPGLNCGACNFSFSDSSSQNGGASTTTTGSGSFGNPAGGGSTGGNTGGNTGGDTGGNSGGSTGGGLPGLSLSPAASAAIAAGMGGTLLTH